MTIYSANTGDEEGGTSLDVMLQKFYEKFGRPAKRIKSVNESDGDDINNAIIKKKEKEEAEVMKKAAQSPMTIDFESVAWSNLNNLLLLYEAGLIPEAEYNERKKQLINNLTGTNSSGSGNDGLTQGKITSLFICLINNIN